MNIKKLLLSLLMFSLIAVSACSPAVTPAPTEDTAQTAPTEVSQPAATDEVAEEPTAAAEPVEYKKEITAVVIVEPKSMDPIYGDAPGSDLYTYNLFYDNLIELVDGEYVPSLAESYTISDDYQDLVFKLRQRQIHDDDFNAEAVIWNLERVKNTADSY
jgi:peptide/nickel transport system substrate-binding protein